jgi:gas vesicle protein
MASDYEDFGTFFAGFVIGSLVGAAAALLFAPQSGVQTRTMIRDKSIELKDRAGESAADLQQRGQLVLEEQKARFITVPETDETIVEEEVGMEEA